MIEEKEKENCTQCFRTSCISTNESDPPSFGEMSTLLLLFQTVSLIFATAAVITGLQALLQPIGFSHSFGISIFNSKQISDDEQNPNATTAYISLMGVRQLAQGLTLFAFAYQRNWDAMATILSILGTVVATTDGYFLGTRGGDWGKGATHAIPGLGIAGLSLAVLVKA
jgi:hypothetical protein